MADKEVRVHDAAGMKNVEVLFGQDNVRVAARRPFDGEVCRFLEALSGAILADGEAREYPDIITFGFYIRRSSISRLAKSHKAQCRQQGRGMAFHIAPSNVPINFAYSLVFGLLAGNSNVVRVSARHFRQYGIICRIMGQVCDAPGFSWARETNAVVRYGRDDKAVTDYLSAACDARIAWGGDSTIRQLRESPMHPRAVEVTFADRYSLAFLSVDAVSQMTEDELGKLAQDFFNDTYLMDQNACSSPHLVCWCHPGQDAFFGCRGEEEGASASSGGFVQEKDGSSGNDNEGVQGKGASCSNDGEGMQGKDSPCSSDGQGVQEKFWKAVYRAAGKYALEDMKASEKYTILCENAIKYDVSRIEKHGNVLYVAHLRSLPGKLDGLRGKYGLFYSFSLNSMGQISRQLGSKKIQTIATAGIDRERLADYIVSNGILGVDRIVPVGHTLDIDVIWDGYDVVSMLSRNICSQ